MCDDSLSIYRLGKWISVEADDDSHRWCYIVPKIPLECIKAVSVQLAEGNGREVYFGVTKWNYQIRDGKLGYNQLDWAIHLNDGKTGHNNKWSNYTQGCEQGDTITCTVNWLKGTVSYKINGDSKGIAYTDELLRTGILYFAISTTSKSRTLVLID